MKSKSKGLLVVLGCLLFCFALTLGAMLGGNFKAAYAAEEGHVHCVCGGGVTAGDHVCSDATFLPFSGGDVTYDETGTAYLYLGSDVLNGKNSNNCTDGDGIFMVKSGQTLYLCLNGHSMQNGVRSSNAATAAAYPPV